MDCLVKRVDLSITLKAITTTSELHS